MSEPRDASFEEVGGEGNEAEDATVLIVVGAHLRAEAGDRPIAYALRERMLAWLDGRFGPAPDPAPDADPGDPRPGHPCRVVVCTDVWYLNDPSLRAWPAVSVGGPGVNALSAHLADKLPGVLVVDDVLMVQMDPELKGTTACLWGIDHRATVSAAEAFADRYLDAFMQAAVAAWDERA